MKNLAASLVGLFAVGLVVGGFVSGSGDVPESEVADFNGLERALATAELVDCGEGREALLEPVAVDGKTSFKVSCVQTEETAARPAAVRPAPVVVAHAPTSAESADAMDPNSEQAAVDDSRSWKQSAVIVSGAAGAGAGIGAMSKGKRGAAVGAAIGAATGAAYELIKRDKKK